MSDQDKPRVVRFTSVKLMAEVRDKLRLLKKELGFANYNALLNYMALELTKGEAIPPASCAQVFRDNRPVVLTGQSGAGKTTTVKELLKAWKGNVFLMDVRDEYKELNQIDLGRFFPLKWERENQRVRFVPSHLRSPDLLDGFRDSQGLGSHHRGGTPL
jgi:hypothetical protein